MKFQNQSIGACGEEMRVGRSADVENMMIEIDLFVKSEADELNEVFYRGTDVKGKKHTAGDCKNS